MLGKAHMYRLPASPVILAVFLLFISAPVALAASHVQRLSLVGPKQYYLALGDSLPFGYQPNLDYDDGYADDFFSNLQSHVEQKLGNLGCPGETSGTLIDGVFPYPFLRKYFYLG